MYLVALVDLGHRFGSGVTLGSVFAPWTHVVISAGSPRAPDQRCAQTERTADPAPAEAHSAPDLTHTEMEHKNIQMEELSSQSIR